MNTKYRNALPLLQSQVAFEVEEITALDMFYNDGDARVAQSLFKLVLTREKQSVTVVYIQEKTYWVSFGSLHPIEEDHLRTWLQFVSSQA